MKLWEPIKCCCCFDRRNGSLIIGVLFLISGCLNLFGSLKSLIVPSTNEIREVCKQIEGFPDCVNVIYKISLGVTIISLVLAIMHITFSSLLIHGIVQKKTRFLVPMMIMYLIQILILLLLAAIVIGSLMYLQVWGAVVILILACGFGIFMETYFLLVIRAHYFDMKRLKGQVHMSLNAEEAHDDPYADSKPPHY